LITLKRQKHRLNQKHINDGNSNLKKNYFNK
jgi:hypothetical protein